jgi:hypothetical protein
VPVLLASCVVMLPPLTHGLVYSHLWREYDRTVLSRAGLYWVGPFKRLRLAPATLQVRVALLEQPRGGMHTVPHLLRLLRFFRRCLGMPTAPSLPSSARPDPTPPRCLIPASAPIFSFAHPVRLLVRSLACSLICSLCALSVALQCPPPISASLPSPADPLPSPPCRPLAHSPLPLISPFQPIK